MKEKRGTVGWGRATHNICDSHLTWRAEKKGYSLLHGATHSTWMTRRGTSGLMGATIQMDDTCMDGYSGLKRGILYDKEKGRGCLKRATYTTQMIEREMVWLPNEDHKHSNRWQRKNIYSCLNGDPTHNMDARGNGYGWLLGVAHTIKIMETRVQLPD